MKYITALLSSLVLAATSFGDAPSKELQALNHYVGTWENTITGNPNAKGTATGQWTLDGRYLQQTWTLDADPGNIPKVSCTTMMTFDAAKGVYRAWQFFSNGGFSSGEGVWDADSLAFTWTTKDGIETWSLTTTNSEGKSVMTVSGKNTKKNPK
jgi:hypothetical protein